MTDYDVSLAARRKALCTVWDFPELNTRFVSRKHAGLTLTGWDHVFYGCTPKTDEGSRLDVTAARLTVGNASFAVPDKRAALTAWLSAHDSVLRLTPVTRRQGFLGDDEANYQVSRWQLEDYDVDGQGGGFVFNLANVLKAMSQSLYDDIDGEGYRLDEATYGAPLGTGAVTITLEKSPKGIWREPGFVLLYERQKKLYELVAYQTIGGAGNKDLQTCTRRKYGVGSMITYAPANTDSWQVWVKRGNPLDIALEWLTTTTTPGANGAHDTGSGDGLGDRIDVSYLNVAAIEALRDAYWPQPTFAGDVKTAGIAVLFVENAAIGDVSRFIEEHILLPFALFPIVGADERYSVETYYRTPPPTTDILGSWRMRDFRPSSWSRNWDSRINNLSMLTDWDVGADKHAYQKPKVQATSITRYGKSKPLDLSGRGHRTGRLGFPDFGGAADIDKAATRVLLELANPGTPIPIRAFYAFKDRALGDLVNLDVPAVPDIDRGARGIVGSPHLITRRKISDNKGYVEFDVRLRRTLDRPAFVAPDASGADYATASAGDRQFCYLTPADDAQFSDGAPAYTVIP